MTQFWIEVSSAAVFALYALAAACAIRAANTARTPQGAVGWVVFLISMPILGIPLYLILGHHRFKGYRLSRLESQRVVEGIKTFFRRPQGRPARLGRRLGAVRDTGRHARRARQCGRSADRRPTDLRRDFPGDRPGAELHPRPVLHRP
ncbi:PLDc N-terminal domain-containing protein [Jhaorihella thermophila]